jgi:formylglycine-generating enzyme required for sulfatase activity
VQGPFLYLSANLLIGAVVSATAWAHAQQASPVSRAAEPLTAAEENALKPKDSFKECDVCPELVVIPAGSFMMGSPVDEVGRRGDEGPQRRVTIARPFAVGKFEVTFAEWDACTAAGGCTHSPGDNGWGRGKRPVMNVSWDDITKEYLPWVSHKTGKPYRLLSEAEWEYAARAGTTTPYSTGVTITTSQASFYKAPSNVGSFPPNAFGLHDMHGNVQEWVQDCRETSDYVGAPIDGSAVTSNSCALRMLRGGSWSSAPRALRSAYRVWNFPDTRLSIIGFRLGRTL